MKKGFWVGLGVLVMVGFGSGVGFAWPVPDTGQTKCYDDEGIEIDPCPGPGEPFYGQDGNYLFNPTSYTKLDADGNDLSESATEWVMVRDNITGLIWEVKNKKDGDSDQNNPNDADNRYYWYGNSGTGYDDLPEFIYRLNSQAFGGYSDWTIPTIEEFQSIVNYSKYNPAFDQSFFPNSRENDQYWSVSEYAEDSSYAWFLQSYDGDIEDGLKSNRRYARAVLRGQASMDRYYLPTNPERRTLVCNGDGTVTDLFTGLMWQQGNSSEQITWSNALSYCENLSLADYNDWRMPSIKEIESIVMRSRYNPAIDSVAFFGVVSGYYWSSSHGNRVKQQALSINFYDGSLSGFRKEGVNLVRAVRGGQPLEPGHLTIFHPRQASKWNIDTVMPITWNPAGISGNVAISLSRRGGRAGTYETIVASTPNDGNFEWTVISPYTVNAMLKIEPLSASMKGNVQGLFSIVKDVSIDPLNLTIREPVSSATFTINLSKAPTADVIVNLSTTNPGEFTLVDGNGNRTNNLTVTLDETNWETGVDVTVRAEADNTPDGDQTSQVLTSTVKSDDPEFSGLNIPNVSVTVEDDQAGVYVESVYPSYGAVGNDLNVVVLGGGFEDGKTEVYIVTSDGSEIEVTPITVYNDETLRFTIPDPSASTVYDLKVHNRYSVNDYLLPNAIAFADSSTLTAQRAKKAIIVAGGGLFFDNDLWTATRRNANQAYAALFGQGYEVDSIRYLSSGAEDVTGEGSNDVDADANLATLETAITDWAVNTEPAATDLLLYLVGPARAGQFLLKSTEGYEVALSASTLNDWLDSIQSSLTGNLIVIIDAPQSGSFLAPLAAPGRIVIAGSSANGRAWFLDDGEISFSWPLWEAVYNDGELFAAFDRADDVIGQVQTPAIDADGDGLPDPRNRRAPDDPITLGRGRDVETDPPAIGKICPDATLETGTAYELWAEEVTADNELSQIWARIFPPVESLQPGDRPVLVLPTLRLQDLDGDGRYAETHDDFTQSGAYKVLIHATDKRDFQSIPKPVRVTQTAGLTFDIGDLNVNGTIDLSDVITALKAAAGLSIHDTLHLEPTGDERIGVPDALFLLQKISGVRD